MTEKIILAGNPNVGKSTLFNRLTGMNQHTGNWSGKTVGSAAGFAKHKGRNICIIDTPGTYSLHPSSPDEDAASHSICNEDCDALIIVCDACCLERGLYLALQIMERRSNTILCVNMMDEAEKQEIHIDLKKLSHMLGIPTIGISASRGKGIDELMELIDKLKYKNSGLLNSVSSSVMLKNKAHEICSKLVLDNDDGNRVHILDKALSSRILACPIMLCILFAVLWISISGANYPSSLLSRFFAHLGSLFSKGLDCIGIPAILSSAIIDGIYGTTAWVVSVMLPPMAIFFPLFALLEDCGLLPRFAFNMDSIFKKCGSCGKQSLCMCMGLGCNAVGVTGCRIISEKREKISAMLTNSFMPCNGRFPTLILMSSLLFQKSSNIAAAAVLMLLIIFGIALSLFTTWLISIFFRRTVRAPFSLELPPYRRPRIFHTLIYSLKTKTLSTLMRAIKVSAPAGLIIWLLANIQFSGNSIIYYLQQALDAPGRFIGLDGAILLGFILGLPANEIVMPVTLMCYLSGTSLISLPSTAELSSLFTNMGWTTNTILCLMVFTICHWPCATTLLTIKKESGKSLYALAAAATPTVWGILICFLIR